MFQADMAAVVAVALPVVSAITSIFTSASSAVVGAGALVYYTGYAIVYPFMQLVSAPHG